MARTVAAARVSGYPVPAMSTAEPGQQRGADAPGAACASDAEEDRARLSAEVETLLDRVSRWTTGSWGIRVGGGTRADVVFALVQELADLAADAERVPRRAVPRLDNGVLPDQLTVMAHDLLVSGSDSAVRAALDALRRVQALVFE